MSSSTKQEVFTLHIVAILCVIWLTSCRAHTRKWWVAGKSRDLKPKKNNLSFPLKYVIGKEENWISERKVMF